ncbi:myxosortase-dependent M36 family metallopeptidase [Cystobacter fuscus]|uniref:myxosortase-dependent M36 family metallopeptidase n=1 Tax=Cystobacter fuscus TaxID=43 RepID=UPI002B312DD4|nr:aldo/keto reductase [Cystobacter fuscus]
MTRLVFKWSSLALALASTGAAAHNPPNYDVLQDAPPSLKLSPKSSLQKSSLNRSASLLPDKATDAHVAHWDEQRALPTFVWAKKKDAAASLRTRLTSMKPEQAALSQLADHLSLYGQKSLDESGASVKSVSRGANGVTIVTLDQRVDGVEVFRHELKLLLDANNELVALSGNLSPNVTTRAASARTLGARRQLTAAQAISLAYRDLTGATLDGSLLAPVSSLRADNEDPYTHYQLAPYARPLAEGLVIPARAKPVLFPMPGGLIPAYYLELNTGHEGNSDSDYYAYVVSAVDGQLLLRNNLTAHADFSYRVWAEKDSPYTPLDGPAGGSTTPHPTGFPAETTSLPPFVAPLLVTLRNVPFSKNDPWLADGATETRGNNVDAYADLVEPDGFNPGDLRASVTAPGVFDRTMDLSIQPGANEAQRQAATTQLFYVNNWLHDWFYDVGFDEASGNAQNDNFGRGGKGNDAIRAESQDYKDRNNANMATPADGASPRMQMYLFDNAVQSLEVSAPASVAGTYPAGSSTFGPSDYDVSGEVVLAASGNPTTTTACDALTNAADVAGKIVLIDRGVCNFVAKVRNAQAAGAIGVIIASTGDQLLNPSDTASDITIPSQLVKQSAGNKLRASIPGLTARLQRKPALDLDGTIDNGIVAHEWGHYISNRLIGNGNGLLNNQGGSMGEGWGDFHALLMIARAEDINVPSNANWNGAYAPAEYATRGFLSGDSTFFGIRRVAYSADMTKNALTFRHISDGQTLPTTAPIVPNGIPNSEVHNAGEIWASLLWDCYVSLLRAYPFQEAQQRMKQYLVNGYKLTPATPTYLEARDALIAAAAAADNADAHRFWKAFARRGAGGGATAPSRYSATHSGVVESYDLIALPTFSLEISKDEACDNDDILDNGEKGLLHLKVRNVGPDQTEQALLVVTSNNPAVTLGNGGQVTLSLLKEGEEEEVTLPVLVKGAATHQAATITVATRSGSATQPVNVKGRMNLLLNYDERPATAATEDVESSATPWSPEHDSDLGDVDWSILAYPTFTNHVFYGENVAAPSDMRLVTPPLKVSGTQPFVLKFKQAWDFEQDTEADPIDYYDGAVIELSEDDGATWVDVGTPLYNGKLITDDGSANPLQSRNALVGQSEGFPALIDSTLDLGTKYAGKTVRLRFRIGSDQAAAATGWLLDDLEFSGITNTPFTALKAENGLCAPFPPPVVSAGEDVSVAERTSPTLHGTATDAEDRPLTYTWTQESGPDVTLSGADTLTPSFPAPEVTANTDLVFKLSVSNGSDTVTDTVKVTVTNVNRAPTAHAGEALSVEKGAQAQLDGTASSDPDGDALSYTWTQVEGTPVTLSGADSATPSFTAPDVDAETTLRFSLVVKDGSLDSAPAFVSVTVTPKAANEPPKCGCSTGAEAPLGLIGLALLALARRRRMN